MYNGMDTHFRALGSLSFLPTPCYLIEECSRGKRESGRKSYRIEVLRSVTMAFQIEWVLKRMALVRIAEQDLNSIDVVGVSTLICMQGLYISRSVHPSKM